MPRESRVNDLVDDRVRAEHFGANRVILEDFAIHELLASDDPAGYR